jgi:hypothetical protein
MKVGDLCIVKRVSTSFNAINVDIGDIVRVTYIDDHLYRFENIITGQKMNSRHGYYLRPNGYDRQGIKQYVETLIKRELSSDLGAG